MMSCCIPTHECDEAVPVRWLALAALAGAGLLLFAGGVLAKPARPEQPSWRSLNVAQTARVEQARLRPRKKHATRRSGWSATQEPAGAAAVEKAAVEKAATEKAAAPLPEKRPAGLPAPITGNNVDGKAANQSLPSPGDIVTTGVLGEEEKVAPAEAPAEGQAGKQYCTNIANAAAEARIAWQKKELLKTEQEVKKRVEELNAKIAEYQKWMARRDEFSRKAAAVVVNIYAKMKPDAAAQQLTVLDEEMAAAVLTKLDPRISSAVMNEMDPKRAARLTAIITGAATGPGNKPPGTPTPASKDKGS